MLINRRKLTLLLIVSIFSSTIADADAGVDDMRDFLAKMEKESPHPLPSKKLTMPKKEAITKFVKKNKSQMVYVKGGSFMMGPDKAHKRWISGYNQPRHKVTLSSYYISSYLVTNGDYDLYTKINQLPWLDPDDLRFHFFARDENHPAQGVTWYQANAYCKWLAKQTNLPFDLPTEAQWEYAARNRGQDVDWASDNGKIDAGRNTPDGKQLLNQKGNDSGDYEPMPVGAYPSNPLGLYDMTGSISQWVKNNFYKYPNKPEINPQGSGKGKYKVRRAGYVGDSLWGQGVYYRDKVKPTDGYLIGFRCAINSDIPSEKLGLQKK